MYRKQHSGFTLIELLVVVTIIVVLLAMLVPAMNKAIYQAELAVCGSQLRGIASAVTVYAAESKRYYPDRGTAEWYSNDHHGLLKWHPIVTERTVDHRQVLKSVIPDINKMLNDPLTGEIDLVNTDAHWVWAPYCLWYGFRYSPTGKMMVKLGQRWSYTQPVYREFDVLVSDLDQVSPNLLEVQLSHPDNVYGPGVTHNEVIQDRPSPWPLAAGTMTRSLWWSFEGVQNWRRNPADDNFAMTDLSVQRVDRVIADPPDERMAQVPAFSGGGLARWNYVP